MEFEFEMIYNGKILKKLKVNTNNIKIGVKVIGEKYKKNIYSVEVTDEIKDFCWEFSSKIITGKEQYDRLKLEWINDKQLREIIKIQRSYVGKIGEVAFLILLGSKNIAAYERSMFEIYKGQENTDKYDFITKNGETIDVKSGHRKCHTRLVVNLEQLHSIPKDYYVGVLLDAEDLDSKNKLIDDKSITSAKIYGYAEYSYLLNRSTINLKESDCKAVRLESLMDIDRLIRKIKSS